MLFREICPKRSTDVPVYKNYKNTVSNFLRTLTIDVAIVMIWIGQERNILRLTTLFLKMQ